MKYCPSCINEYRDEVDIDICPDCGEKLLEGENPRFSNRPEPIDPETLKDLVELSRVTEQWEADFIRTTLEKAGIVTAQVPSEHSTLMHIPPVEVTDMIKIYVAAVEKDRALEILNNIDVEAEATVIYCPVCIKEVARDATKCPHCGATLEAE